MRYTAKSAHIIKQTQRALELMGEMEEYARSIGCTVLGEEIQCSEEQGEKLAIWWEEKLK